MLTVHDVEDTVAEVRWAAEHDMKGIILPQALGEGPSGPPVARTPVHDAAGAVDGAVECG